MSPTIRAGETQWSATGRARRGVLRLPVHGQERSEVVLAVVRIGAVDIADAVDQRGPAPAGGRRPGQQVGDLLGLFLLADPSALSALMGAPNSVNPTFLSPSPFNVMMS